MLPGLNALRFFAASAVLLCHIEQQKAVHGFPSLWAYPAVQFLGEGAVTFFFVLSGFLITHLLLNEKRDFGTVSIRLFYIRRALRILPLYYFVVLFAFFVVPNISFMSVPGWTEELQVDFWKKLLLYLILLPQLACSVFSVPVPYASQAWSIGVEEIFYFFWPWCVRSSKQLVAILLFFVLFFGFLIFPLVQLIEGEWSPIIEKFFYYTRLGCIALGGLTAILVREPSRVRAFAYHRFTQIFCLTVLPVLLGCGAALSRGTHELYSLFFGCCIANIATNPGSLVKLRQSWLDQAGKISYGIYMYHLLAVVLSIRCLDALFPALRSSTAGSQMFLTLSSFVFAIVFAQVSYRFFESPFLDMKKRFTPKTSANRVATAPLSTEHSTGRG